MIGPEDLEDSPPPADEDEKVEEIGEVKEVEDVKEVGEVTDDVNETEEVPEAVGDAGGASNAEAVVQVGFFHNMSIMTLQWCCGVNKYFWRRSNHKQKKEM